MRCVGRHRPGSGPVLQRTAASAGYTAISLPGGRVIFGFAMALISGSALPYFVGFAWAAVGFVLLGPTRSHLARDQEALDLRGCPHRLVPALRSSSSAP
ncbi:MAG: hypothetical protein AB7L84_12820 [Acidimicrobiia bacterium]